MSLLFTVPAAPPPAPPKAPIVTVSAAISAGAQLTQTPGQKTIVIAERPSSMQDAEQLTQGASNVVAGLAYQERLAAQRAAAAAAAARAAAAAQAAPVSYQAPPAGVYSFAAIEQLWVSAGGPAWAEWSAATIAECESGGNPRAYNPSGASGIWQILGQVADFGGSLFDPMVNAVNAVAKFNASGQTFAQWVCTA